MESKQQKFFPGEMVLSPGIVTKAAGKVCTAITMADAMDKLHLSESAIKDKYQTFRVDDVTFVQL